MITITTPEESQKFVSSGIGRDATLEKASKDAYHFLALEANDRLGPPPTIPEKVPSVSSSTAKQMTKLTDPDEPAEIVNKIDKHLDPIKLIEEGNKIKTKGKPDDPIDDVEELQDDFDTGMLF